MKFLLIISMTLTPIFSLSHIFSSKKKCINCKHYMKPEKPNQVGKCSLFPILNDMDSETEDDIKDAQFLDCISSRRIYYMCGERGRYYEKVVPVEYPPFLSLVDPTFFDEISEFDLNEIIIN